MGIIRLLRSTLFIYECFRIFFIAIFAAAFGMQSGSPLVFFAAPTVLFPLMALFLWLDAARFRPYQPLFAAGKIISIAALLGWLILSRPYTILSGSSGLVSFKLFLLGCDFFALASILYVIKSEKKPENTPGAEGE